MLHTLRQSPFQFDIHQMLPYLSPQDDLLLIEDGVYAALPGPVLASLGTMPIQIYALRQDIEARGLSAQISREITCVDYTEFVKLAVRHTQHFAW